MVGEVSVHGKVRVKNCLREWSRCKNVETWEKCK